MKPNDLKESLSLMSLTEAQERALEDLTQGIKRHDYPSWPNLDNEFTFQSGSGWTSDCRYGCGAWMGGFCSGARDSDADPFGECPNAPDVETELEGNVLVVRTAGFDAKPGTTGFQPPEVLARAGGASAPARRWTITPSGAVTRLEGDSKLGDGR